MRILFESLNVFVCARDRVNRRNRFRVAHEWFSPRVRIALTNEKKKTKTIYFEREYRPYQTHVIIAKKSYTHRRNEALT